MTEIIDSCTIMEINNIYYITHITFNKDIEERIKRMIVGAREYIEKKNIYDSYKDDIKTMLDSDITNTNNLLAFDQRTHSCHLALQLPKKLRIVTKISLGIMLDVEVLVISIFLFQYDTQLIRIDMIGENEYLKFWHNCYNG